MSAPSVAVVMPARNAAAFVEEAIRSALEQTCPPDVVVVVDDGSTDRTADIARATDDRVLVLCRPHEGIGASRNAAIRATSTDLVAFLDADDVWLPRKLELQQAALDHDPSLDAVFCLFDEWADGIDPAAVGIRPPRLGQSAPLACGALLRRRLVDRLGPFGGSPVGDWLRWWARARALEVREHVVPEVLWRRRLHGANNSLVRGDGGKTFLEIAREHRRALQAGGGTGAEAGR